MEIIGARPKASAKAKANGGDKAKEEQEVKEVTGSGEAQDHKEAPTQTIQPHYIPPLPRPILAARIGALERKKEACGDDQQLAKRKARTERLLEDTKASYKEAGGGHPTRTSLALVAANKQLYKLERSVEWHQRNVEEKGGIVHAAIEDEREASAKLQRVVRERDNARAKAAYLAIQSAQEAAQTVHWFEGTRNAVEGLRTLAMQAQQPAYVPLLDLLSQVANALDPAQYQEDQDPLLQGVDISEDSSEKESSYPTDAEAAEPSGSEMEGIVEGRCGRKRGWEERWETAEDREQDEGSKLVQGMVDDTPQVGKEVKEEVEDGRRRLRRDTALLVNTVEANQQIEEQERLQRQQDVESEVLRAKLEIEASRKGQGANHGDTARRSEPRPNPRLDLATARHREVTPCGSEESSGEEEGLQDSGSTKNGRRRRKKSRTPRGRLHGQDTMD